MTLSMTKAFGLLNLGQFTLHGIENLCPRHNPTLFNEELNQQLPQHLKDRLKRIEQIKDKVCEMANISAKEVPIRIQKDGVVISHGNRGKAVLSVGIPLLKGLTSTSPVSTDPDIKLLDSLPDDPEKIRSHITKLTKKQLRPLKELNNHLLDLSDEELEFIIAHEIMGHLVSNDAFKLGVASTLLGVSSYAAAECIGNTTFPSAKWILHPLFYLISRVCLQQISKEIEKKADESALKNRDNSLGALRFFKRFVIAECIADTKQQISKDLYTQLFNNIVHDEHDNMDERLRSSIKKTT